MADSPSELKFEIEKLERKHAENPEGRFFVPLANAYRKMGDIDTAETLLRSGVERHPDYLSAHIVLGRCLADRGAVPEAEEEFRFVLSQDPQNLIALRTLGELAVVGGRPGEAANWYRELLAVDPMNEDARQALDGLAGAPAPEVESEFRSGAGWWEPSPGEGAGEGEPQDEPLQPPPVDGLSRAEDELGEPAPSSETTGEFSAGEFERFSEAGLDSSAAAGQPQEARDDLYGWEDLPGVRAEEAAAPPEGSVIVPEDEYTVPGADLDRDELPGMRSDEIAAADAAAADAPSEETSPTSEREQLAGLTSSARSEAGEGGDEGARFAEEGSSEVVTETIAELYARQGLHERAASVYRELIRRRGGDPALEQRLAEFEQAARADGVDELAFADEEALVSPTIDGEDDPFAASFEEGFATVDQQEEVPMDWAPAPEVEAAAALAEAMETVDAEEHPLPELAPAPAEEEPDAAERVPQPSGGSIADLLVGIASWRRVAPTGAETAGWEPSAVPSTAEAPTAEAPVDLDEAEAYVEPWETPDTDEEGATDLPYLEEVGDTAAPEGGTGSAEDEPFPWELPGGRPVPEEPETVERPASELDPFFIDDVEPEGLRSDQPLPEGAPAPAPESRQEPAPVQPDPTEDEDLESFQAWLRSLKR